MLLPSSSMLSCATEKGHEQAKQRSSHESNQEARPPLQQPGRFSLSLSKPNFFCNTIQCPMVLHDERQGRVQVMQPLPAAGDAIRTQPTSGVLGSQVDWWVASALQPDNIAAGGIDVGAGKQAWHAAVAIPMRFDGWKPAHAAIFSGASIGSRTTQYGRSSILGQLEKWMQPLQDDLKNS